jgi:hypothetical protein
VDLAIAAIKSGTVHQLRVVGLSKPDVIEYLPAEDFVPGSTWSTLVTEWKAWLQGRPDKSRLDFKSWLRRHKHAKVHTDAIRSSAERQDSIPLDVSKLLHELP